jgi:hypothetical protein
MSDIRLRTRSLRFTHSLTVKGASGVYRHRIAKAISRLDSVIRMAPRETDGLSAAS